MLTVLQAEDKIKKVLAGYGLDYKTREKKDLPLTIAFYTRSLEYVENDIADAAIWIYIYRNKASATEKNWQALQPVFPEYFLKISVEVLKSFHGRSLSEGRSLRLVSTETLTNDTMFQHVHKFNLQVDIETDFPEINDGTKPPRLYQASAVDED